MNVASIPLPQSGQIMLYGVTIWPSDSLGWKLHLNCVLLSCPAESSARAGGAARASSRQREDCARAAYADFPTACGLGLPGNSISQAPLRQASPLTQGWGMDYSLIAQPYSTFSGTLSGSIAHSEAFSRQSEVTVSFLPPQLLLLPSRVPSGIVSS